MSRRVLDYSALQSLAEQVIIVSEKLPVAFDTLKGRSMDLKEVTMLSSGLGINQIWSTLRDNTFATPEILRLEGLAVQIDGPPSTLVAVSCGMPMFTCSTDLRKQVLNLMAMASISRSSQHDIETRRITEALELVSIFSPEMQIDSH